MGFCLFLKGVGPFCLFLDLEIIPGNQKFPMPENRFKTNVNSHSFDFLKSIWTKIPVELRRFHSICREMWTVFFTVSMKFEFHRALKVLHAVGNVIHLLLLLAFTMQVTSAPDGWAPHQIIHGIHLPPAPIMPESKGERSEEGAGEPSKTHTHWMVHQQQHV
jgi:hypothetical protein